MRLVAGRLCPILVVSSLLFLAASSAAAAAGPHITSVSPVSAEAIQTINILGSGFGSQSPYNGDSRYLQITDLTKHWAAGYCDPALNPHGNPKSCVPYASPSDSVALKVTSWTGTTIKIRDFTFAYGQNSWTLDTGDQIQVEVWNPKTHAGPAIYTTTVTSQSWTNKIREALDELVKALPYAVLCGVSVADKTKLSGVIGHLKKLYHISRGDLDAFARDFFLGPFCLANAPTVESG